MEETISIAWFLMSLYGCNKASKPTYVELQEACNLGLSLDKPLLDSDGRLEVSEACSETIGHLVGMKWSEFDEEPHAFSEPITLSESIIGGIYLLVSYNNVTVESILGTAAPRELTACLSQYKTQLTLDSNSDSGRLWFDYLSGFVDTVSYNPDTNTRAYYGNKTITIGSIDYADNSSGDTAIIRTNLPSIPFLEMAMLLAHEAGHGLYKKHIACPSIDETNCDETREGPFGISVWWGYLWILNNYSYIDYPTCGDGVYFIDFSCGRIIDDDDWVACMDIMGLYDICHD